MRRVNIYSDLQIAIFLSDDSGLVIVHYHKNAAVHCTVLKTFIKNTFEHQLGGNESEHLGELLIQAC